MSNRVRFVLKHFYKRPTLNRRFCSTVPQTDERDPAPLFFDYHVQSLLRTLTRIDYLKIFSLRKDGSPLEVPQFKFMTDEELEMARASVSKIVEQRIHMPPVVKMETENVQVLSVDTALQGAEKNNIVFTDISFGYNNKDRLIVVREPNGVLRRATSNERHRMNQIYFPVHGREMNTPKMFYSPYLDDLLEKGEFEFILDRACLQFEPNNPEYHRITKQVYSYLNESKKFNALQSTRHFGPFVFHLAWENHIDALLINFIQDENITEAGALIQLYHRLHPEAKSATETVQNDIELITVYAQLDSPQSFMIINAINAYEKKLNKSQKIKGNIMKAHGLIQDEGEGEGDGEGEGEGEGEDKQPKM